MRALIGLAVIVYLAGFGLVLAPNISGKFCRVTASDLSASVMQPLPGALAWTAGNIAD